jgi:multidrug efflux pump subunit AcrB
VLTSLVIAYTVAPWAAYRFLKIQGHEQEVLRTTTNTGDFSNGTTRIMGRLIADAKARRYFFLGVGVLMLAVLAMPAFSLVQFKMLPKNNTNTFNITVDMPEGTALEETDRVVRRVGDSCVARRSKPEPRGETA